MYEFKKRLDILQELFDKALEVVNLEQLKQEKLELEDVMQDPHFWDQAEKAAEITKKVSNLDSEITHFEKLAEEISFAKEMVGEQLLDDKELDAAVSNLEAKFDKLQIATFFTGKFDKNNVILTVICGMGGKDAQDFTKLITQMYQKYCEKSDFDCQVLDISYAEAGFKSATLKISGQFAYGWLKFEHGVHRLIRLSPFNTGNTRETSFVMVDVLPEVDFDDSVKLEEKDLRIDAFKSSGPGGQSVNTTDSAVRITHLPTSIVVSCQNERSQHQNKENAMRLLTAKLVKLMHDKQAQTLDDLRGHKNEISFGNQIRTYTMHPYQFVKDHRTNFEFKNIAAVLEGNIDEFLRAEVENLTEIR